MTGKAMLRLPLIAVYLSCHDTCAVRIGGTTEGGMTFTGRLTGVSDSVLRLIDDSPGNPRLGIPLDTLERVHLAAADQPDAVPAMETLSPLLPFLDPPSLRTLLHAAAVDARKGDWHGACLRVEQLAPFLLDPADQLEAGLLKAEALLALGLYRELDAHMKALNARVAPINAPARLCALNARLQLRGGNTRQARFWAQLPALRIPAATGPLADELASILRDLTEPASPRHP